MASTLKKKSPDQELTHNDYFELGLIGMATTSLEKGWLQLNDRLCMILGYSREELLAMTWAQITHPDDLVADVANFNRILNGEVDDYAMDKRFVQKNGTIIHASISVRCIRNEDGTPHHFIAMVQDITEREQMLQALRESEASYRLLFNNLQYGFAVSEIICDGEGVPVDYRYCSVNASFERLTGRTSKEVIGRTMREFFPEAEDYWVEQYGKVALTGERVQFEAYSRVVGRYYEVAAFRPKPNHFAVLFSDVTDRRNAEEEKRKSESMLRQSQKLQAIGTLAGGIAHDFNNILGAILGNAQLIRQGPDQSPFTIESVDEILKASFRAKSLVQRILAFSRQEVVEHVPLQLRPVIEEAVKLIRVSIPKNLEICADLAAPVPDVLADSTEIHQVVMNLLTNAFHAMEDRPGKIHMALATVQIAEASSKEVGGLPPGKYVKFLVSDQGMGMDAATCERIFEPFFTTKSVSKGTGLGLSVIHGIMTQIGGAITVESKPDFGTTFYLYFPALESRTAPEIFPSLPPVDVVGNHSILFIDDEPANILMFTKALELKGFRVESYASSEAAILAFQANPHGYDLIVTDYSMPEKTGLDVINAIRAIRERIPVVLISGHVTVEVEEKMTEDRLGRVLNKPCSMRDFFSLLHELLHPQGGGHSA